MKVLASQTRGIPLNFRTTSIIPRNQNTNDVSEIATATKFEATGDQKSLKKHRRNIMMPSANL